MIDSHGMRHVSAKLPGRSGQNEGDRLGLRDRRLAPPKDLLRFTVGVLSADV